MSIFLGLGDMQLTLALAGQILRKGVIHVLFGEEDVHVLESGVIGCHAVVLQTGDDLHAVAWLVLLGQGYGYLLGAVVAEVEENHHVAFLDAAVNGRVDDGFDKLIGHTFVIRLLNSPYHVVALLADAGSQHVISHLDAVPIVVTVHRIVATDNGCYCAGTLLAVLKHRVNKALAALGVGVTAIHEAVHIHLLQAVFLGDVTQGHQMLL